MFKWFAAILAMIIVLVNGCVAIAGGFVKADGPILILDGKQYRAIGVNMPGLFSDYVGASLTVDEQYGSLEKSRQHVIDGVNDAQKSGIAFMRFWATGYWPRDMALYLKDPQAYWKGMDEVFAMCREKNIKLVPSIFFNHSLWPMVCDEDVSAIADPSSKAYQAMRKYAKELVTRYKDDTNILMWEITNEGFLGADVNMIDRDAPDKSAYLPDAKLIKTKWKQEDSLTTAMLQRFYKDMAAYIKSIDPNHLVTSGDGGVRETSVSLREGFPKQDFTLDTLRANLAGLLASQPEPLDVFSVHSYGPNEWLKLPGALSPIEYARSAVRCVHAARAPIFVGELGNSSPSFKDDPSAKWTLSAVDALDKEGADLIAIWVWYFPHQPGNTFTSSTHPALVKRISELNAKYAKGRS
ncbi:MAG: cellulase family glycosylhydrolase [Armatimonadota bacterium]